MWWIAIGEVARIATSDMVGPRRGVGSLVVVDTVWLLKERRRASDRRVLSRSHDNAGAERRAIVVAATRSEKGTTCARWTKGFLGGRLQSRCCAELCCATVGQRLRE